MAKDEPYRPVPSRPSSGGKKKKTKPPAKPKPGKVIQCPKCGYGPFDHYPCPECGHDPKGEKLDRVKGGYSGVDAFQRTTIGRYVSGVVYVGLLIIIFFNFALKNIFEAFGLKALIQSTLVAAVYNVAPGLAVTIVPIIPQLIIGIIIFLFGFFVMPRLSLTRNIVILVIGAGFVLSFPTLVALLGRIPAAIGGPVGQGLASIFCMMTSPSDIQSCMIQSGVGPQVTKEGGYEALTLKFGTEDDGYTLPVAYGDKERINRYYFTMTAENPNEDKKVKDFILSATIKNETGTIEVDGEKISLESRCNEDNPCTIEEKNFETFSFDTKEPLADKKSKEITVKAEASYSFYGEGENSITIYRSSRKDMLKGRPVSKTGPLDVAVYFIPAPYVIERDSGTYLELRIRLSKKTPDRMEIKNITITELPSGFLMLSEDEECEGCECVGPWDEFKWREGDGSYIKETESGKTLILEGKDLMKLTTHDRTYMCKYKVKEEYIEGSKSIIFKVGVNYNVLSKLEEDVTVIGSGRGPLD